MLFIWVLANLAKGITVLERKHSRYNYKVLFTVYLVGWEAGENE